MVSVYLIVDDQCASCESQLPTLVQYGMRHRMRFPEIISTMNDWPVVLGLIGAGLLMVWKLFSKPLEKVIEVKLTQGDSALLWHRLVAFVIIVHLALAFVAFLWCMAFTELPPPTLPKQMPLNPIMPLQMQRLSEYSIVLAAAAMGGLPLFFRMGAGRSEQLPAVLSATARASPTIYLAGTLVGAAYVVWCAHFDTSQLTYARLPTLSLDMALWYHCCITFYAYAFTLPLFGTYVAGHWLWKQVSEMEG